MVGQVFYRKSRASFKQFQSKKIRAKFHLSKMTLVSLYIFSRDHLMDACDKKIKYITKYDCTYRVWTTFLNEIDKFVIRFIKVDNLLELSYCAYETILVIHVPNLKKSDSFCIMFELFKFNDLKMNIYDFHLLLNIHFSRE